MKIEQIKNLCEAARYQSISAAAEKNFITQPAFSSSITSLEKELGIPLLHRSCKGISLTDAGQEIVSKSKEIISLVEEINNIAKELKNTGSLSISTIPCLCYILPIAVKNLRDQGYNFIVNINTCESSEVIHEVLSGISTLGFIVYDQREDYKGLNYEPIFTDSYNVVVSKNSPLWGKDSVSLEEALQQPIIAYRNEYKDDGILITSILNGRGCPKTVFRTNEMYVLQKIIEKTDCISFFPRIMSTDDVYLKMGLFRAIPVISLDLSFEIGFITRQNRTPFFAYQLLIKNISSLTQLMGFV